MYQVEFLDSFKSDLRNLSKKYPRVRHDISNLLDELEKGNFLGDPLQGFSALVYKVRVGSIDQKKGKRGGFRVIYYVATPKDIVYAMMIYAKAQQEDLTPKQKQKLKEIIKELKKL